MKALQTLVIAAALATAGAAAAQTWQPDPKAPYDVQSDDARYDGCSAKLTGNVRITQGRARLLAKSGVTHAAKKGDGCDQPDRIDLDGNVFYITPDGRVRSNKAVYDLDRKTILFTGDVVVIRGDDVSTSNRLTVNMKDDSAVMEGGFRALIMPSKDSK